LLLYNIKMPALSETNTLVLVTGATGFIGTWIVRNLLESGYRVRAAVRTEQKGQHLLKVYRNYGEKLTLSVIGDMSKVRVQKSLAGYERTLLIPY